MSTEDVSAQPYKQRYDWPPLKRAHSRVPPPIGYMRTEDDQVCVINPDCVEAMDSAIDLVTDGQSLRFVAAWLSEEIDRPVSHQAIKDIYVRITGAPRVTAKTKKYMETKFQNRPKTAREKRTAEAKDKLRILKSTQTKIEKKLASLTEDREAPKYVVPEKNDVPLEQPDDLAGKKIIFRPNPGPQEAFLAASEQEVLYGGAAGGGKSYALLADPMRYFNHPKFNGLLVRRTNDELRELKWKSKELYPALFKGAQWKEKDSMWLFPSGAQFWMTYLERDDDVHRYQGQAFSYIAFDELTHWSTPFAWNYMRSRLRTTSQEDEDYGKLPVFMRATTNPGGPGHGWVKRMFIDPAPYGKAFTPVDWDTNKPMVWPEGHPKAGLPLFERRFIPAKLSDNPFLYEDGQYEANLLSQGGNTQRQLLHGDWDVADGAAFSEFRQTLHVVEPFEIPNDWVRFRSCDFGYSSFSAVHWYAIDPAYETLVVYRELYVSKKTGQDLAQLVIEAERGERIQYGMLDSSVWHQRGQTGPSIAEEMIAAGTKWRPADRTAGARVNGKNRLHELLKCDEYTGRPGIIFFNTCRQIISDLPVIPTDPDGGDDIDKRYASDHAYDSIRYGIMSRPRSSSPFDFSNSLFSSYRPANPRLGY